MDAMHTECSSGEAGSTLTGAKHASAGGLPRLIWPPIHSCASFGGVSVGRIGTKLQALVQANAVYAYVGAPGARTAAWAVCVHTREGANPWGSRRLTAHGYTESNQQRPPEQLHRQQGHCAFAPTDSLEHC